MKRPVLLVLTWILSATTHAADPQAPAQPVAPAVPSTESWIQPAPTPYGPVLIQQAAPPPYRDYQMSRILTPEEQKNWLRMAMPMMANTMKMDAREAMNHFAVKYKVRPGVSFDEVVESMKLRANQINLKLVGSNLLWKDFRAVLNDQEAPRIEVHSFCDIAVARDLLRLVPEIAVFMPCRIVVMEDADKNIWIMTLDWDATRLSLAGELTHITPELRQGVLDIRDKLEKVMRAGANGEL